MAIEAEIVSRLKSFTATATLVGSRVYPVVLPAEVSPAVTYRRLSGTPELNVDGSIALTSVQMEISAWGNSYEQARTLADAIFSALDGYSNASGIMMIHASFGPDLYEPAVPDSVRFRCLVEVEALAR